MMDESSSFANLQQSINKMKIERDELMQDYLREKTDFSQFDIQVRKMEMEFSMRLNMLKEKEMKLAEYNKMIDETDKTYMRIVETTNKLAANLDKECNFIKEKFRKNQYQ